MFRLVELEARHDDDAHIQTRASVVHVLCITSQPSDLRTRKVEVQTKVWYTFLGKGRTDFAVKASLAELGESRAPLTVLLHWPRCRRDISWMRCEEEESELSPAAKASGPPPHLDPESAWTGSWEALEELYYSGTLALHIGTWAVLLTLHSCYSRTCGL